MAKALNPATFAVVGRDLLIGLEWVPAERKAYWKGYWRTSALAIATELCETHPVQMAALRDKIEARPTPKPTAAAPRAAAASTSSGSYAVSPAGEDPREVAERREMLSRKMGTGAWAPDAKLSTSYDARTGIQTFGVGR